MGRWIMEWRSYKQNYTPEQIYSTIFENRQYLVMMKNLKKQALANRTKCWSGVQLLMNNLGFNLCVVPQSLVVRLVVYFRMRVSQQGRGPRNIDYDRD